MQVTSIPPVFAHLKPFRVLSLLKTFDTLADAEFFAATRRVRYVHVTAEANGTAACWNLIHHTAREATALQLVAGLQESAPVGVVYTVVRESAEA